jgi:hypothetical protein
MNFGDWLVHVTVEGAIHRIGSFIVVTGVIGMVGTSPAQRGSIMRPMQFDTDMPKSFQFRTTGFAF